MSPRAADGGGRQAGGQDIRKPSGPTEGSARGTPGKKKTDTPTTGGGTTLHGKGSLSAGRGRKVAEEISPGGGGSPMSIREEVGAGGQECINPGTRISSATIKKGDLIVQDEEASEGTEVNEGTVEALQATR